MHIGMLFPSIYASKTLFSGKIFAPKRIVHLVGIGKSVGDISRNQNNTQVIIESIARIDFSARLS